MSDLRKVLVHLEQLNVELRHDLENAEARLHGLNDQLLQLHRLGLLGTTVLLGPVVLTRPYPVGGPTDSGQVIQAVLALPGGFGAVYWHSETIADLRDDPDARDQEALMHAVPFGQCEPAIRGLLVQHVAPLLTQLLALVRMRDR